MLLKEAALILLELIQKLLREKQLMSNLERKNLKRMLKINPKIISYSTKKEN